MAVTENAGVDIHYWDHGGGGPPVVFSHGFLMDHEMFDLQVGALKHDYRCITWDQRGFGATEANGPFTFWDSADDLLSVMDACGIESATTVGMSQGGFLSLRAALTAPDRIRALFLIDSQAGPEDAAMLPTYEGMVAAWAQQPTEDLARAVAGIIVGPADHEPWVAKWIERPGDSITEPFQTLIGREDIHDQLPQITQPVAVVHGDADVAIPLEMAQRLCEELPGCDGLTVIEGAGHAANLSHPEKVNEVLRSFLSRRAG